MGNKVTLAAYRTAGRPVQVSIDPDATEGARVGSDLTLGSAVTLPNGQVLPAGTVLAASQIMNAFAPIATTGGAADWNAIINIPPFSVTSNNSNGVVLQDLSASFGTSGLSVTVGTVNLDLRYEPVLPAGGTTGNVLRGDKTWSNSFTGNMILGDTVSDEQRLNGNIGINGASYGAGSGVVFIANANTVPSANPVGGGIIYAEGGALKYRGSSGTVTTLAPA